MSLINDALKKAQNQRTGHLADAAPMPGGSSGAGRGQHGMPPSILVLLGAGAVAVVIISVVTTVYYINRTPAPKVGPAPVAVSTQPVAAPPNAPSGTIPAAGSAPPAAPAGSQGHASSSTPSSATVSVPAITTPSPVIIAPVIVKASPPPPEPAAGTPPAGEAPAASTVTAPPTTEPVVEGSLEDRINAFVDKLRVTGIRTSESGSKVLMNDHVYRVNDLVDRKLGLKLVKIAPDSLTFADAKGATYIKSL